MHRPFTISEQGLTSQIRNVKILFRCYIARKDSHIIDKMCLIIICNWRIILKEVLVRVSLGLDDFHSGLEQMVGCCEHSCEHLSFILYYVGNLLIL